MLTTLLSLLGGGLGGLLRLAPAFFKFFEDKGDREHEYRMSELQLKIDQARSAQAIDLVHAHSDAAQATGELTAYIEAIKGQGKMTGVPWVDALNQSVRPVVTYWWMALLSLYKVIVIVVGVIELQLALKAANTLTGYGEALTVFAGRAWTPQDAGVLSMILGFWFVDRALRHNTGR